MMTRQEQLAYIEKIENEIAEEPRYDRCGSPIDSAPVLLGLLLVTSVTLIVLSQMPFEATQTAMIETKRSVADVPVLFRQVVHEGMDVELEQGVRLRLESGRDRKVSGHIGEWSEAAQPVIYDVNTDGKDDVLLVFPKRGLLTLYAPYQLKSTPDWIPLPEIQCCILVDDFIKEKKAPSLLEVFIGVGTEIRIYQWDPGAKRLVRKFNEVDYNLEDPHQITTLLSVKDLDRDGKKEVIVGRGEKDIKIFWGHRAPYSSFAERLKETPEGVEIAFRIGRTGVFPQPFSSISMGIGIVLFVGLVWRRVRRRKKTAELSPARQEVQSSAEPDEREMTAIQTSKTNSPADAPKSVEAEKTNRMSNMPEKDEVASPPQNVTDDDDDDKSESKSVVDSMGGDVPPADEPQEATAEASRQESVDDEQENNETDGAEFTDPVSPPEGEDHAAGEKQTADGETVQDESERKTEEPMTLPEEPADPHQPSIPRWLLVNHNGIRPLKFEDGACRRSLPNGIDLRFWEASAGQRELLMSCSEDLRVNDRPYYKGDEVFVSAEDQLEIGGDKYQLKHSDGERRNET